MLPMEEKKEEHPREREETTGIKWINTCIPGKTGSIADLVITCEWHFGCFGVLLLLLL